jgi:hypothetical protein
LRGILATCLVLAFVLVIGAGSAWSSSTAAPPSLKIEVIGAGQITGTGINCGVGNLICSASYGTDPTAVTLTEAPSTGWTFVDWEDGCTGTATTCTASVTGDMTVTAVFAKTGTVSTASYGVSLAGFGGVTTGAANYPIDCSEHATGGPPATTQCGLTLPAGSTITVSETPDGGNLFGGWGGACTGTKPQCSAYLSGDRTVTANFVSATTDTLSVSVDSGGSVAFSGGGLFCPGGSTCTYQEPANSLITMTATAASGFAFTGWAGACTGLQASCTVQMDSSLKSVTANFDPLVPILLTVSGFGTVSGAGTTCGPGPATCTINVPPNTSQILTATPSTAGGGVSWTGCTSVSGTTCRISVSTTPPSVTATFTGGPPPPSTFQLSVSVDSGAGYVTSSDGSIYCTGAGGAGCTAQLSQNSTVTLTAVTATGAAKDFDGWSGDCLSFNTASTCTLTMNGSKSVSADFEGDDATYTLTAQVSGTGSGTITGAGLKCASSGGAGCSSPQANGATVTVTATPAAGSTFTGWSGACSGAGTSCKVAMTAAKSVTATFAKATSNPELAITVKGGGTVKTSAGVCTSPAKETRICTQEIASGTKVTLTATPAKGQAFFGWSGACTGGAHTCTLTLSKSAAVTATFAPPTLVASHKPRVTRTSGRFQVAVAYSVKEKGTLKLLVTRSSIKASHSKSVAAKTNGTIAVEVAKHGRYTATLTLTSKTGVQTITWIVTV